MRIGTIVVTPEGLEKLAKGLRILQAKSATLEVHKDDDTHGCIRLCLTPEGGWIDIEKGWV